MSCLVVKTLLALGGSALFMVLAGYYMSQGDEFTAGLSAGMSIMFGICRLTQ